jgi:hypothetical protein
VASWAKTTPQAFVDDFLTLLQGGKAMKVTPRTFRKAFEIALKKGEEGMDACVGLYLWARDHQKELHAADPKHSQDWVLLQIRRVFNTDAEVYVRTAIRLGGGKRAEQVAKGRAIIKRFGTYETFRADKLLGPDQMLKLIDKLPATAGPDELRIEVHKLHEDEIAKLRAKEEKKNNGQKRVDYKKAYEQHIKRIAELEKEVKVLRRELSWFKKNVELQPK